MLENIKSPRDIKELNDSEINLLRDELREKIIDTVSNNKIDSTTIAKALSAKIPSYEAFEKALNHGVAQVTLLNWKKNNVIDYINKKSYIVTPRVMAQKLKQLKELIENDVRAHGRDVNKIYYNVPVLSKSYSLVNYMYQKINNIDSSRYLYCDTTEYWCCKDLYKELEKKQYEILQMEKNKLGLGADPVSAL